MNCTDTYDSLQSDGTYKYQECAFCEDCFEGMYEECYNCTKCTGCVNNQESQNPPGLKGHTFVSGRNGLLIYGGITMDPLNMTEADRLGEDKRDFSQKCQSEINRAISEN